MIVFVIIIWYAIICYVCVLGCSVIHVISSRGVPQIPVERYRRVVRTNACLAVRYVTLLCGSGRGEIVPGYRFKYTEGEVSSQIPVERYRKGRFGTQICLTVYLCMLCYVIMF